MSKLDLRKLRAFVTVVEEGSISRADERLFIQQPQLNALLYLARREDSCSSAIVNTFCDLPRAQLVDN